jgi:hypothetical protein
MSVSQVPVNITIRGHTVGATITFGSDNRKSLMLAFDESVWVGDGFYAGMMPVLWDDETLTYRDLVTGTPVTITDDAGNFYMGKQQ